MHATTNLEIRSPAVPRPEPSAAAAAAYSTVVLGVDSTISAITGIDWLAARRGEITAHRVATLFAQLREGAIAPDLAYAEILSTIRPRREDLDALSRAYVDAIAPDCADTLARFRRAGVRIVLVSSGLRHAMYRIAYRLGIDSHDVHAIDMRFDALGAYTGYDHISPLTSAAGKRQVIAGLDVDRPLLAVAESGADAAIRDAADRFVAFGGESTDVVPQAADVTISSFAQLAAIVLA